MKLTGTGVLAVAAIGAVAVGAVTLYMNRAAIGRAADLTEAENPINNAADAVVSSVVGREETLGGMIYDFFHPDANAQIEAMKRGPVKPDGSLQSVDDYLYGAP